MPEMKRNETLEKIRAIAKQDEQWMKSARKRQRMYRWMIIKGRVYYKWLRIKRFFGFRK